MPEPVHPEKPQPVGWHPEEIRFLLRSGVLVRPGDLEQAARIKLRWIHSTLREVFLTPSGFVLKRFSHFPGRKDYRRVWVREHLALKRLEGLNVPRSLGYIPVSQPGGVKTVLYVRSLLPGQPLARLDQESTRRAAELLAAFHRRGVVTLDPSPENFLALAGTNELGFIDFGRARTFRPHTPYAHFHVGKELIKVRHLCGLDRQSFQDFLEVYRACRRKHSGMNAWLPVRLSMRYWGWRYDRKGGKIPGEG